MAEHGFDVPTANIIEFLQDKEVVPQDATCSIDPLGDWVSNRVVRVRWDAGCVVVKQPLGNFDISWDRPIDVARIHSEAQAIETYGRLIDDIDVRHVNIPDIVLKPRDSTVMALGCASTVKRWRHELSTRTIDRRTASFLGLLLGSIHMKTRHMDLHPSLELSTSERYDRLRLDIHQEAIMDQYPAFAASIEAEINRVLSQERALVHGDFCPRNVLVDRSVHPPKTWLIDFEYAHRGDPAFDTGYMLNYLVLRSVQNPQQATEFIAAAEAFWNAYDGRVAWDIERPSMTELAIRMLSRVDGKAPLPWIDREMEDAVRTVATEILSTERRTVPRTMTIVRDVLG